jgi:hypothetical protein
VLAASIIRAIMGMAIVVMMEAVSTFGTSVNFY